MMNQRFSQLTSCFVAAFIIGACNGERINQPSAKLVPHAPVGILVPVPGFATVVARDNRSCAIGRDGHIECWTQEVMVGETPPPSGTGFTKVSVGDRHACALRRDGGIECWGDNSARQLFGVPTDLGFTEIAAGGSHTCALTAKGTPICWGDNASGQLDAPVDQGFTMLVSGATYSCALGPIGNLKCWGIYARPATNPPTKNGFVRLYGGLNNSCVLDGEARITCWGSSGAGQLNGIPTGPGFQAIAIGADHSCALNPAGHVLCWGDNTRSQLVGAPTDDGYRVISTFLWHTCALRGNDLAVVCWGDNSLGQLAPVPTISDGFVDVSAGASHTCAVIALDLSIRCWGGGLSQGGNIRPPATKFLPAADLSVPTTVPEGTDVVMTFSNAREPGYDGPVTFYYAFTCGTEFIPYDVSPTHSCPTTDNGSLSVVGGVEDNGGYTTEYPFTVTVQNVPPTLGPIVDDDGTVGKSDVSLKCSATEIKVVKVSSFTDPGSADTWIGTADWGDGTGSTQFLAFTAPRAFGFGHCYARPGNYTARLTITDDDGGTDTKTFDLSFGNTTSGTNVQVTPVDPTTGAPAPVQLTFGNVSSGGTTTVTSQPVGGGGPPPPSNFRLGSPATYYNIQTTASYDGTITVCLSYAGVRYGNESQLKLLHGVTAANGTVQWVDVTTSLDIANDIICGRVTSLSPFLAAELNVAPVVGGLRLPTAPVPIGTSVSLTAPFSDANPGDTHTAVIDWESQTVSASVSEYAGAGTVSGTYVYAQPGVYTIRVTVSDGALSGSHSSMDDVPAYVVVYDPRGGFATGGGWFTSSAGALIADPTSSGKASFGFVAKYKPGATLPDGDTEFQFEAGRLKFSSTSYDWLVVAGSRAQFKGDGTINGSGSYRFLLTAIDGGNTGDRFRIKIWDKLSDALVYDNQRGQPEDSDAATVLGGGSIVIHKN